MKYVVSMLMAAFIFALLVFAIVYWLLQWSFKDSITLGAITIFIGLLSEVARFFLLKKRSDKAKQR
jgi:divalent metal cation (Fe/Co/Zn/Cd) transporter